MIRVVLAVSSNLYRQSIREIIKPVQDINIVQEISQYPELVQIVDKHDVDVLFLDINLSGLKINDYLNIIRDKKSPLKILLLLNSLDNDKIINALCLGVKGCLDLDANVDQFVQAIRAVNNEEIWADVSLISKALNKILNTKKFNVEDLKNKLTKKEERIAQLILQGFSNKDIAKEMFISEKTVKTHIGHIFKKLGIKSRYQLAANYLGGEIFPSES